MRLSYTIFLESAMISCVLLQQLKLSIQLHRTPNLKLLIAVCKLAEFVENHAETYPNLEKIKKGLH